jgi:predicted TIM-barrel fold metal-dependent hydrolase
VIIDSHVHILPERVRSARDEISLTEPWFAACHQGERVIATAAELVDAMDRCGVDMAVCFAWPFADPALCAEANDHLAAAQRAHAGRIVAFATVNPAAQDAPAEIERCARMGLRGIGELNCDAQGFSLDAPEVDAAVAASISTGLPWTLHCSEPVGHMYAGKGTTTPDRVASFATRHPELRLVCAHLGGGLPFFAHMPEIAALSRRLWFDTAAGPFLYAPSAYRAVVDLCGADRLLFGSDFPLLGVERYRDAFATAPLDAAELELVMGGAAGALLGL